MVEVTDPNQVDLFFDIVKPKLRNCSNSSGRSKRIRRRSRHPSRTYWVVHRPARDSPTGLLVAGGDGGGYAFGDTNFYLNIGFMDDFVLAKSATTHELYHAVQGAFAVNEELPPNHRDCR